MKQEEVAEKMGKIGHFESPLAGPLPPSRMGPAYSPFCPFWPLLPLGCFGMYWIILARSSMILRLNHCSCPSSGSTPSTGKCLTRLLGIDLASLWSLDELRVGFFFPSFPKAMRGIPPGRCKLHGPGSTWKASQRLHKKLKQANKKTKLKKQPEIPVRQAGLSSEIKISRAKIRQRVVKRHIHSKYAPKTCIPSISKRLYQMPEGENQTN